MDSVLAAGCVSLMEEAVRGVVIWTISYWHLPVFVAGKSVKCGERRERRNVPARSYGFRVTQL